jgi:GDP-mannose transporter
MSQQLHRRNPSNESIEALVNPAAVSVPAGSPSKTPERRSGGKKNMKNQHEGDVEMNTALISSPNKLKSKDSNLHLEHASNNNNNNDKEGGKGSSALTAAGWKAVSACTMYSFCSVSMILVNKSLASRCVRSLSAQYMYERTIGMDDPTLDGASTSSRPSERPSHRSRNFSLSFHLSLVRSLTHSLYLIFASRSYNHLIDGDLNILLVVFQAVVAVVCVETCKHAGWIEHYPSLTWDVARAWAPVNILFCAMLFTGMASLQTNSVPMVTVFKNVTNVLTTAGDYFFFGNKPELMVIAAFGIMLFGAVAAAWNDITVSGAGLFWMGANCVSTAGYVLYMKFATVNVKLTKFGMVHVNNMLCVVFLLPVAMVMGEVTTYLDSDDIHTADYLFKNIFAGFVGFFLNFASLNCVQATGPTTYAIVGSLNKVPVAFLGYILFDNVITFDTWCYIVVSMFGGFLYSYAMIAKSRKGHKN